MNYTTNRILEIPQDINIELKDNVLTVKAGTKLYIPNGFESDGITPKFNTFVMTQDITFPNEIESQKVMFGVYLNRPQWRSYITTSGNSFPSNPVGSQRHYKTDENLIYTWVSSTGWTTSNESFPLGVCTYNNDKKVVSVDQLFNGFGYIGSTLFALPGIKCQIADGNNNDGTLKSFVKTIDNIIIRNNLEAETGEAICFILDGVLPYAVWMNNYHISTTPPNDQAGSVWFDGKKFYKKEENGEWKQRNLIPVIHYSVNQGKVTRFAPFDVNSINCYSRSDLSSLGMPSNKYIDLTLGASGSTYIAPANGYLFLDKAAVSGQYIEFIVRDVNNILYYEYAHASGDESIQLFIPIERGRICEVNYTAGVTFSYRFIYAQGDQ